MEKSLAFDITPMVAGLHSMGVATGSLMNSFSEFVDSDLIDFERMVRIDTDTLKATPMKIDTDTLKTVAMKSIPRPLAEPFVSAFKDIASGGMAVFGSPKEIENRTAIAIPWTVISDIAFSLQGTPAGLRSALGIEGATTANEAIELLRNNFPNFPDWMLKGRAADRLISEPAALPLREPPEGGVMSGEEPPKPPGQVSPKTLAGSIVVPPLNDALAAARCLIYGTWEGLGGHWWGWAGGWQVRIDKDCADRIANILMGLGGGPAILDSIRKVVASETIAAGIKALSITAGLAISIYGFVLGALIKAVNWAKGVIIQGNWPVVGGPGAFVWAIAG